ncbi:response regulator transcription factor [Chelativorans sp. M5D2P16]|uniref:response regulator transcription factor n=1 Tax=Chelativorans sp. M5D2P16 TaxID=3095678 RepID=UPI002ACAC06B|nr:response regulator transcription factor [Chelativorans sp. M5D2P16]MDZ5697440.1 response regulator transcription factor [Chelativorans sp. M5D2P16]
MSKLREQVERVRVLIAEDQTLIREGLITLLAQQDDNFEILPGAADGEQAIEFTRRYRPDVILMDLQMPRVGGIAATQRILREFPSTHIVVLTTFETDDLIFEAVSAGAKAYLLKDARIDEIAATIRAVTNGQSALSPSVAARILEELKRLRPRHAPVSPRVNDSLTAREKEILRLVVEGKSNSEIGKHLHLAEGTIKNHVSTILEKCGARNRTELAIRTLGLN